MLFLLRGIRLSLCLLRLAGLLIYISFHDLIEVRFIYHCAGLRALGLLLQILTKEVEIEFALFDLRASL
jgi:hypothetical protein